MNRSRSVMNLFDKAPVIGRNAFIAPNALVSGDVRLGNNSSVFYGSVIRGTWLSDTSHKVVVAVDLYG